MLEQFTPSEQNDEELLKTNDNNRENLFDRRKSAGEENLKLLDDPEYVAEMQDLMEQLINPNLTEEEKQELRDKMSEKLTPVPSLGELDLDRDVAPEEKDLSIAEQKKEIDRAEKDEDVKWVKGLNTEILIDILMIDNISPGFREKFVEIKEQMELSFNLEEDEGVKNKLKDYFQKTDKYFIDSIYSLVENGGETDNILFDLLRYYNLINSSLAEDGLEQINVEILDPSNSI